MMFSLTGYQNVQSIFSAEIKLFFLGSWKHVHLAFSRGGGDQKNFNRGASVTFLGLKFDKLLFFCVAQNEGYFWG